MSKNPESIPKYCRHRQSGRAYVTLDGQQRYLGTHGTMQSRAAYQRLIAEWLCNGRRMRPASHSDCTVIELLAAFLAHAKNYYVNSDGVESSETDNFKGAMRPLKALYGSSQVADFGPLQLKTVRQRMIELGWCRNFVNAQCRRIRSIFKWGVGEAIVPPSVLHGLQAITGLRAGRTTARESAPVKPVAENHVNATMEHLSPQVRAIIELQLATGARPGEICQMRSADIDTTGNLWVYRPARHKTQHHGHERAIYLGPRAREIVRPFLKTDLEAFIFTPEESEAWRRQQMHDARETPISCGNAPGSNRKKRPERRPGELWRVAAYRRAIERACDAAFPLPDPLARQRVKGDQRESRWEKPVEWRTRLGKKWDEAKAWRDAHRWHPHQLRHTAATRLRKEYGLEAAQVILGHKTLTVTQIYAERNVEAAMKIMGEVG